MMGRIMGKKSNKREMFIADTRRANSGAAWQPSCQKLSELAEIIAGF